MAIIKVRNPAIDLDAAEIPNIDASKITSGSLGADRIPGLSADKITTGTFADARIAASNVSQHATSFDDNKLVNDISTLAIRQASNENKGAYNTNSMYVDVFQDDTGIASNTNAPRSASEYVSTYIPGALNNSYTDFSSSNFNSPANWSWSGNNLTINGTPDNDDGASSGTGTSPVEFGANKPFRFRGGPHYSNTVGPWFGLTRTSSDTRVLNMDAPGECYFVVTTDANGLGFWAYDVGSKERKVAQDSGLSGYYYGISRDTYGIIRAYQQYGSAITFTETPRYTFTTDYSANTYYLLLSNTGSARGDLDNMQHDIGTAPSSSATGNFISNAITAPSSVSSMGAIVTYQDASGTNALNTDIVLQLSADGGSTYSTATLTALPDFSTGIKMAKVNDLAVTAGTQLKYKINFANQASGSKEARIRGVALQY